MKYPYIQNKNKIEGICEKCKKEGSVFSLEWRIDWFQGNCEFESICGSCLNQRTQEENRKEKEYFKRMEPIWEKQRKSAEDKLNKFESLLKDNGIQVDKYSNGQWSFNKKIDWWDTTGTAIERKSRKRHHFSISRPEQIISIIKSIE